MTTASLLSALAFGVLLGLASLACGLRLSALACLIRGRRYAITNRTRAGLYCPVRVCVRCGRDAP